MTSCKLIPSRASVILLAYVLACGMLHAQSKVDSLKQALANHKQDTSYVKTLINLCNELNNVNKYAESYTTAFQALDIAKRLNYTKGIGDALGNIGVAYYYKGKYDSAEYFHTQSIEPRLQTNDKRGLGIAYSNIGLLAINTGNFPKALTYHQKSLAINKELNLKGNIARDLYNIGTVYYYQGNYPKTLDYFLEALKINEQRGNKKSIISNIGGIAVIYAEQKDYKKAMEYFQKEYALAKEVNDKFYQASALQNITGVHLYQRDFEKALKSNGEALTISREINDQSGISSGLNNISSVCIQTGKPDEAIKYADSALAIAEKINNQGHVMSALSSLAQAYLKKKDYSNALKYATRGLTLSKEAGVISYVKDLESILSEIHEGLGNHKEALAHYKEFIIARDSLMNDEKTKELTQKRMSYEFDKQIAQQKAEQEKQQLQNKERQKQQTIIIFSVIAGFLIMSVFSFFLYKRFRITNRQKKIIEDQKKVVETKSVLLEEANKEVMDSIVYAKRLQEAILPPAKMINTFFPDNFILYKPKAVVAGDFYWMEKVKDRVFFAACDCTGHGVPGAMVSVVCSNALTRAVKEFELTDPGAILTRVRELVIETFEKSESEVKDGMDISFVAYPLNQNGEIKNIYWAGANNALYYSANGQLLNLNPDKQPIGKSDLMAPFTTNIVTLKTGECFYLVTDGYADQFGGPHGKKLKQKTLKLMLEENLGKDMRAQREVLDKAFEKWKTHLEQVDDVTIIGVRV